MTKTVWFYVFAIAALAAGGWYYYFEYRHTVVDVSKPQAEAPNVVVVVPSNSSDEETNRKRQEGIGSIKDLKPVPIGPAPGKGDGK
jgi:hypothetical protein